MTKSLTHLKQLETGPKSTLSTHTVKRPHLVCQVLKSTVKQHCHNNKLFGSIADTFFRTSRTSPNTIVTYWLGTPSECLATTKKGTAQEKAPETPL